MPRPRDGDTRCVLVLLRHGHLQLPLANAVPDLTEWTRGMRHVVGDHYVGAVVIDARHPAFRPDRVVRDTGPDGLT